MSQTATTTLPPPDDRGLHAYQVLRAAVEIFGRQPSELEAAELSTATKRAEQAQELENLVLDTEYGRRVSIPDVAVDGALKRIRERFDDDLAFDQALLESGVVQTDLRRALWRELAFDAVLSLIGEEAVTVTDDDIEVYYTENSKHLHRPEQRTARHILITINDDFSDNTALAAEKRIDEIAAHLELHPGDFESQATRHSECPSALEGGLLGDVMAGKLYPELDEVLFQMQEGAIAGPLESEAGFHLILCEKIVPGALITLEAAREKLREHLTNQRRKAAQKAWIKCLKA